LCGEFASWKESINPSNYRAIEDFGNLRPWQVRSSGDIIEDIWIDFTRNALWYVVENSLVYTQSKAWSKQSWAWQSTVGRNFAASSHCGGRTSVTSSHSGKCDWIQQMKQNT
jgi:hypothetical protein